METFWLLDVSKRGKSSKKTDQLALKHLNNFLLFFRGDTIPPSLSQLLASANEKPSNVTFKNLTEELRKASQQTVEPYFDSENQQIADGKSDSHLPQISQLFRTLTPNHAWNAYSQGPTEEWVWGMTLILMVPSSSIGIS